MRQLALCSENNNKKLTSVQHSFGNTHFVDGKRHYVSKGVYLYVWGEGGWLGVMFLYAVIMCWILFSIQAYVTRKKPNRIVATNTFKRYHQVFRTKPWVKNTDCSNLSTIRVTAIYTSGSIWQYRLTGSLHCWQHNHDAV